MSPRPLGFLLAAALASSSLLIAASAPARRIWQDPGDVGKLDFSGAMGAPVQPPRAPYHFVREDLSGTQPKIFVRDAAGTEWNVKFGYEVKPESFGWRLARAGGYYAEPCFYVKEGIFEGMSALKRPSPSIQADGKFREARFQWRDPAYHFVDKINWSWKVNPFRRTKELNGLKVILMLTSNFDNKDGSDHFGPNTGVFQHDLGNGRSEYVYTFTDWGSSMGYWGHGTGQTDWRCEHFTEQTKDFVKGVEKGEVVFGYAGLHTDDFKTGIKPADLVWLMHYLRQITDDQLRAALRASGATPMEEACFTSAIRARLDALQQAAGGASAKPAPAR